MYVVDHRDLQLSQRGGPPGNAGIVRVLPEEVSPNLGVGFGKWEGAEVSWAVLYDETLLRMSATSCTWPITLQPIKV